MINLATVAIRPVTPQDETFLFDLYASTRQEELDAWGWDPVQRQAFLQLQFRAQRLSYQTQFPDAQHSVIEQAQGAIGAILINRTPEQICLVSIALLPQYRHQGLGTWLLQNLMVEATQTDRPITLHVAWGNPAMRLYQRLGFRQIQNTETYVQMDWREDILIPDSKGAT
jgi:ribosomal protein S18 acetylase RimI-like enzyme